MRDRFPFFKANPDVVYLDSAATSQALDTVIEDTSDFLLNHKANAHRSGHSMGAWVDSRYHEAKDKIGKWLDIINPQDRVIFNSGASQGLYDAVKLIQKTCTNDMSVYVGIDAHHSLLLPLRQVASNINYIDVDTEGLLDLESLENEIKKDDSACKIVAISAVSNVLGTVQDLDKLRSICNNYNVISIIDACQSMGKILHNYNGFDFVTWSWHKIYGPMGLGCLLIGEDWLKCDPVHPGGGSVSHVNLTDAVYLENSTKFESGTQNLQAICTLPRLLDWLIQNQESILSHDRKLTKLANHLCDDKIVESQTGLISFASTIGTVEDITMMLDAHSICVRGGKLCAEPLVSKLTTSNNLIRLSWAAYTTTEELEYAFEKIGEIRERISRFV